MSIGNWTTRILVGAKGRDSARIEPAFAGDEATQLGPAPEAAGSSLVGRRIGVYQITKRLGAGGVGEVFKGVDTMLKREVAIKIVRDELASDPVFLARFRNEAQLHAKLSHPNVASVHAFLEEGDKQFLVMEYVAGISVDEFIRAGGPVPVPRALEIFRRALDGIEHAHSHGIVHRDIKPANIMLADSGQVKVMDFGIARAIDSQEQLTRIGHVAGTAKAMSPEQIRGQKADVRSDVYSLGIVLYTLLAGRAPFDSANDVELMKAQVEQAPPPLRGVVDNLPPKVEAVVMRSLEKDPAARFQSAREFARAVDACIAELTVTAPPMTPERRPEAPTTSRTAINPALQGVKRLPAAGGDPTERAAPAASPAPRSTPFPWVRTGAVALAVLTLMGGATLLWSQFSPGEPPLAGIASGAKPARAAPASIDSRPPAHADAAAPTSGPGAGPQSAAADPAAPQPSPVVAVVAPAAPPAPAPDAAAAPRTVAIVRLASDGKVMAAGEDAATAVHRFRAGERIRLQVTPSHDAHIYCYLQDETRRIVRFYPNRFQGSALVKAGERLAIPGRMRFELVANSLKVAETVACFAGERDLSAELPPAVFGADFAALPATSLDEVREAFARLSAGAPVEGRFRIDVR